MRGTSFVLGAGDILKGQELFECALQPRTQEETADSMANGVGIEVRPAAVCVFGKALGRLYLSMGDEHPTPSPDHPLLNGRCPVNHLLSRRQLLD